VSTGFSVGKTGTINGFAAGLSVGFTSALPKLNKGAPGFSTGLTGVDSPKLNAGAGDGLAGVASVVTMGKTGNVGLAGCSPKTFSPASRKILATLSSKALLLGFT
jgi:hypothetical protein